MAGADLLLPMAAGAALSWASYSVVAHVVSKRQISTLRTIAWGALGTLSLVLGVCAFSAVGAEHQTARKDIVCAEDNPECYAKTHHNPVRECKQVMDKKATFRHVWQESEAQPVFGTYLWHDEKNKTIQAFGNQANAINSLGIRTPLQYFCVFNADTGNVIAASFE
ncbi:hypothetical protein NNQ28_17525 [Cronobacter dublinensis]|uniref:hypothetical protein n=1 Tax=Cronobacter dublinensis TaxID=413497 RepID=UPI00292CB39A|nr:hypothetical protein [Cronobacter dublinensis]WNY82083.1 hypothetical protein NNQ28_17525 [Cronobacter dublinensis]